MHHWTEQMIILIEKIERALLKEQFFGKIFYISFLISLQIQI